MAVHRAGGQDALREVPPLMSVTALRVKFKHVENSRDHRGSFFGPIEKNKMRPFGWMEVDLRLADEGEGLAGLVSSPSTEGERDMASRSDVEYKNISNRQSMLPSIPGRAPIASATTAMSPTREILRSLFPIQPPLRNSPAGSSTAKSAVLTTGSVRRSRT